MVVVTILVVATVLAVAKVIYAAVAEVEIVYTAVVVAVDLNGGDSVLFRKR